ADSRMRSEQLERLRRELNANPTFGFTAAAPWNACYAYAVKDTEFWNKELTTPTTLFLARSKRAPTGGEDEELPDGEAKRRRAGRSNRTYKGEDKSRKGTDGTYSHNRRGVEICRLYNADKCGSKQAQGKCKSKRSHQCNKCLADLNASGGKQPKKVPPSAQAAGPRKIPGLAIKRKAAPKSPEAPPTKKQRKEAEESRQGAVDDQEEEELVYEEESATSPTKWPDSGGWYAAWKDLDAEFFQAGWIATRCGTFSPLREKPPGPRVIRTIDHITGIPDPTKAEAAQLRDSNILVHRSYKVAHKLHQQVRPWGLENPDHPPGKPSLWMMPRIEDMPRWQGVDITRFDQCITGLETTKPTKLYTEKLELSALKDKRCNHEKKVWTREDGATFEAAHNPTVQRWEQVDGKMQRASKSQGEYTELLSKILAVAFHKNVDDKWKMEQLRKEML
ncbi:Uncharacterized protein SCF082_LOCUS52358, partial [Durusdinium trenchii]